MQATCPQKRAPLCSPAPCEPHAVAPCFVPLALQPAQLHPQRIAPLRVQKLPRTTHRRQPVADLRMQPLQPCMGAENLHDRALTNPQHQHNNTQPQSKANAARQQQLLAVLIPGLLQHPLHPLARRQPAVCRARCGAHFCAHQQPGARHAEIQFVLLPEPQSAEGLRHRPAPAAPTARTGARAPSAAGSGWSQKESHHHSFAAAGRLIAVPLQQCGTAGESGPIKARIDTAVVRA